MGFWSVHVDSMAWSIGLGLVFLGLFRRAARHATAGVPGGLQNFVEIIVEFIDETVESIFSHKNDLIAPLALTIFVWVFLMNLMDLVPVDWVPELAKLFGVHYMKIVPTTDPNITMAMALSVFVLILYYSVKCKGLGGFLAELSFHPFPWKPLAPVNFMLEFVTLVAKPVLGIAAVRKSLRRGDDLCAHRAHVLRRFRLRLGRRRFSVRVGRLPFDRHCAASLRFCRFDRRVLGSGP